MIENSTFMGEERFIFKWLGTQDYLNILTLQKQLVEERREELIPDTILFLEHPHTITKGRRTREGDISNEALLRRDGIPIYEVARGGRATYHGPGQLVVYPIINLEGYRQDVHWYLRRLEDVIIEALDAFDIRGEREAGYTGVWVGGRKIASIGIGIRRWVTYHGIALNVETDLSYFERITPCGIEGVRMVSMEVLGVNAGLKEVMEVMKGVFCDVLRNQAKFAKSPKLVPECFNRGEEVKEWTPLS